MRVLGFGVNPYDAALRSGAAAKDRPLDFPIVPGVDVAGIITAIGPGVTDLTVGDQVLNYRPLGGYSEYVRASVNKVARIPDGIPVVQAAGLPQSTVVAHTILRELLQIQPGNTIAVIGAAGSVGSIVLQLAHYLGLRTIAIAHSHHHETLTRFNPDEIGHYDLEDVGARFTNQADYVVNASAGGNDHGVGVRMLKRKGQYVSVAFSTVDKTVKPSATYLQVGVGPRPDVPAAFALLQAASASGEGIRLPIATKLPMTLAGVIAAHELILTRHGAGKIVCVAPELEETD
ncbi:NADP-dependent oxidoreductase [Lacticaseibacillus thailandensis]|uniref:NADP-dependent oxidoreductase n=1 Tax=Lacticaseibacillus thailandensis TaxID=381741 RepID=UPI0009EC90A6|nr:NADP-dependent oxidoreductase [Lacticaseibacillus thailandensis]